MAGNATYFRWVVECARPALDPRVDPPVPLAAAPFGTGVSLCRHPARDGRNPTYFPALVVRAGGPLRTWARYPGLLPASFGGPGFWRHAFRVRCGRRAEHRGGLATFRREMQRRDIRSTSGGWRC